MVDNSTNQQGPLQAMMQEQIRLMKSAAAKRYTSPVEAGVDFNAPHYRVLDEAENSRELRIAFAAVQMHLRDVDVQIKDMEQRLILVAGQIEMFCLAMNEIFQAIIDGESGAATQLENTMEVQNEL